MTYCLSIDWLALFCLYNEPLKDVDPTPENRRWVPAVARRDGTLDDNYDWQYELLPYGSRQFSRIHKVSKPNEEGGRDEFAEVQSVPYSPVIHKDAIIVRFVNRALYTADFWQLADLFLKQNHFTFKSISRIDICADFNQFATYDPRQLIEDFAAKKLRHVGRGLGAMYFNHGKGVNSDKNPDEYGVMYNGLAFGTHSSDVRVYLYNKSFELLTEGDKPWIRDVWSKYGLNQREVWRLEVSIKAKGMRFKDKATGVKVTIDAANTREDADLAKIFHTFESKLFAFVRLPMRQKNISREPRVILFDEHQAYDRGVIRNKTGATRSEKIIIKALYQLADKYRGAEVWEHGEDAQNFAYMLAGACDLGEWMGRKINEWEKPIHK